MEIVNEAQLANSREKLQMLEEQYEVTKNDDNKPEKARAVTMRSLKRLINQLKEEIARFEAGHAVR